MIKMLLLLIILLLVSCSDKSIVDGKISSEVEPSMTYKDHEGHVYETIEIGHVLWLTTDLKTTTSIKGVNLNAHTVEGYDALLYNAGLIANIKDYLSDEWRLPTEDEWYEAIQSGYELTYAGMYDFSGQFQWQGQGYLYACVSSEGSLVYYYSDGTKDMTTGHFHLEDAGAIRLVKDLN